LKKLRKKLLTTESSEEVESLKKQMHVSEVDLNYAQYYPLNERYISLFPKGSEIGENDEAAQLDTSKKPPMWAEVERRMEEGTLDELRNGTRNPPKIQAATPAARSVKFKDKATGKAKKDSSTDRKDVRSVPAKPAPVPTSRRERRKGERELAAQIQAQNEAENDSDGGFFEE
jgi:hypothetical protein